uniref:Dioicin-2 n=1 Tax=Phytolacca dioica TaxID=29725 RepID=RIPD2_PHYDI|nr:RecName: Full=Dioicin-2; AltName: Full=Ribosome-inactivating protein; AltName: Full=rRNA N-glycosidase [Phytolacca dioica]
NIVFDVENATPETYSSFLTSLREAVKDKKSTCHGMIMATTTTELPKYVLVDLKLGSEKDAKTFTLAIRRGNLYLEGYSDIYNEKCRYRIFEDSESDAQQTVCPGDLTLPGSQNKIPYKKSYQSMESKGGDRTKLGLGQITLESRMNKIYGKDATDQKQFQKNEAEFLLIAVQMITEASRFKYIENKVKDSFDDAIGYKPDPKAISLETSWDKISNAIAKVNTPGNSIVTLPKGLLDENKKPWTTATMDELKNDIMGLLTHVTCKIK